MNKLVNSCNGQTASNGGLNLSEFKKILSDSFPNKKKQISQLTKRKEIEQLCKTFLLDQSKQPIKYVTQEPILDSQKPTKNKAQLTINIQNKPNVEKVNDQTLINACNGKSKANGGLNLLQLKTPMIKKFPDNFQKIAAKTDGQPKSTQ